MEGITAQTLGDAMKRFEEGWDEDFAVRDATCTRAVLDVKCVVGGYGLCSEAACSAGLNWVMMAVAD